MRSTWDVVSVVLACMHNWNPMGVGKKLDPEDIHPLRWRQDRQRQTRSQFMAVARSLPQAKTKPSFTVVRKKPRGE